MPARGVEEHLTCVGLRHLAGRDQRELVEQALRVLHDADDGLAALRPRVADAQVELRTPAPASAAISLGPFG